MSYHMGRDARKHVFGEFANNKGADQPALPPSLIISKLATSEFSIFYLVSVSEDTGLILALSEIPKTDYVASPRPETT